MQSQPLQPISELNVQPSEFDVRQSLHTLAVFHIDFADFEVDS